MHRTVVRAWMVCALLVLWPMAGLSPAQPASPPGTGTPSAPAQPAATRAADPLAVPTGLPPMRGLSAEHLLLVVNGNSPVSVRVGEFYVRSRLVPEGRMVRLDLPASEEIPFEVYERNVVLPVRRFLRDNQLAEQVRCVVLFHGVPLRVAARQLTDADRAELADISAQLQALANQARVEVERFEAFARELVPTFSPRAVGDGNAMAASGADQLLLRLDWAARAIGPKVNAAAGAERESLIGRVREMQERMLGDEGVLRVFAPMELADPQTPAERRDLWRLRAERFDAARRMLRESLDRRFDPTERARARELARDHLGLLGLLRVLQGQRDYFGTAESHASLDSELAMLWHDQYPRDRWVFNPMHYGVTAYQGPRVLMTARVDGEDGQAPIEMMLASLRAERNGLRGRVVIDSRGVAASTTQPEQNAYAAYDQTLRNLAELLRTQGTLPVLLDEQEAVLPPNSVRDVAVYVGWYSVGNYVPCCRFVIGAVGYHVASFEMVTLRDPQNRGWVRGLLGSGVAATMGSVAEPYLFAFPDADEFIPLLMTGELTLAETYWRTQKTASWQMSLVGDPLYRPFKAAPALPVTALPERLRGALRP
ncbi:MAG: TIGR03790 family protein [Tepidisphaerales bacterium]